MKYIYLLKNKVTHRIYVGCSCDPNHRFRQHMSALKSNRHTVELMQNDFDLYGEDSFCMEIICQSENFTRTSVEGRLMIRLRTYDRRFGYNYKDPYVLHRTAGYTKNVPGHDFLNQKTGVTADELLG